MKFSMLKNQNYFGYVTLKAYIIKWEIKYFYILSFDFYSARSVVWVIGQHDKKLCPNGILQM